MTTFTISFSTAPSASLTKTASASGDVNRKYPSRTGAPSSATSDATFPHAAARPSPEALVRTERTSKGEEEATMSEEAADRRLRDREAPETRPKRMALMCVADLRSICS